jgi:hypothetical protein
MTLSGTIGTTEDFKKNFPFPYEKPYKGRLANLKTFGHIQPMLMKMDYEQFCYVTELRSGVKGHFAYREAAWQMYLLGKNQTIADLRVTPPWEDELLTR